ncbi:MAG TPA: hypothetical protein VNH11_09190 [Pirellulales bacterium]|nr:hypothetical protein [Pirellulales bacterium]
MDPKKLSSRRSRAALYWAGVTLVAVQAILAATIEFSPAVRDPEFGAKLSRLKEQLAARPRAPLLLVLGSSRSASGICPADILTGGSSDAPLVFNLALTGYGPIQQLQLLDRIHQQRISPRWILAEIHPLLLHQEPGEWGEEQWMRPDSLDRHDLAVVGGYLSQPRKWLRQWARLRLAPAFCYRFQLLNWLSPGWLDTRLRQDGAWRELDACGWLPLVCETDRESTERRREEARRQYAPALWDFRITATADRALREFVEVARRRGIRLGFYLMPEGEAFRSWYTPEARQQIESYLDRFEREERVPVFDATTWCRDADFSDSHHLLSHASPGFSRRFGEEIVRPFLALSQVAGPVGDELARPPRAGGRR